MIPTKRVEGLEALTQVPLPPAVEAVLADLERAGYDAYVVGGAARNLLWGWPVEDWDVATNAPWDLLAARYGTGHPGARFGTVQAAPGVEVTIMRAEEGTEDARHPARIRPVAAIEEDLSRRDFTVNAVAFNRHRVAAVPGAAEDLKARRWRAVGDPERRFREDGLRLMRLARLAAVFGGWIAADTFEAAWRCRTWAQAPSRERRLWEWTRMLSAPAHRWRLVYTLGLAPALELPEGAFWEAAGPVPASVPARRLWWLWAAFGAEEPARAWIRRWPLTRAERRALEGALAWIGRGGGPDEWAAAVRRGVPGWGILADWARAHGVEESLYPLALAVSPGELGAVLGVQGAALGRLTAQLWAAVSQDPALNRRDRLWALARRYLAGSDR
ncbi:MAG: CCA tRNA nucleotidyltransferase [Firmicutes bacterium]|nr:CCA tRNA nucleotidyltransferase [Alicyclobacillaceae bacterium]MCL6497850.1 CCA tRNA nucleotidyltransferase [Bacillota bacterium]